MFTGAPGFLELCPNCEDYIVDDNLWCYNDACCINCCPPNEDNDDNYRDDQEEPE